MKIKYLRCVTAISYVGRGSTSTLWVGFKFPCSRDSSHGQASAQPLQWENSLAIRLPLHLVKEIHLTEGVEVDLVVIDTLFSSLPVAD